MAVINMSHNDSSVSMAIMWRFVDFLQNTADATLMNSNDTLYDTNMMHYASLCDYNVGSCLYRGRLQSFFFKFDLTVKK